MAGTVNKVILIGNLGKDPEVRILENGTKLVRFPMATSEEYTDKISGERKSITEWHNVVVWRGLADIAEKYLSKGQKVYIEGRLRTRSWKDEAGTTRYSTDITGDTMTMLSKREENTFQPQNEAPNFKLDKPTEKPKKIDPNLLDDDEDDLPF